MVWELTNDVIYVQPKRKIWSSSTFKSVLILVILISRLYFLGWIGTELNVMLNYNYSGQNVIVMICSYFPWIHMWKYVIITSQNKQSNIYYISHHSVCITTLTYTIRIMGLNCWHTLFKSISHVINCAVDRIYTHLLSLSKKIQIYPLF